MRIDLDVNGVMHSADLDPSVTLLEALREHLGLPGAKEGCGTGACGACTVLVDERRINACLTLAVMQAGRRITTIEGLAAAGEPHPLQEAFIEHDGLQCGYCTPGQIMAAAGYLRERHPDAADPTVIREWMSGNLCRCGAYPGIVAAISAVAGAQR
jgi:xanthine dehydrogenase YagT iron-sulfur-binding subunit